MTNFKYISCYSALFSRQAYHGTYKQAISPIYVTGFRVTRAFGGGAIIGEANAMEGAEYVALEVNSACGGLDDYYETIR